MSAAMKRKAPAIGEAADAGAGTTVAGKVRGNSYSDAESPTIAIRQEKGFVRLLVVPEPVGGYGLPSTYSSFGLALLAAERLHRERGWKLVGESSND